MRDSLTNEKWHLAEPNLFQLVRKLIKTGTPLAKECELPPMDQFLKQQFKPIHQKKEKEGHTDKVKDKKK